MKLKLSDMWGVTNRAGGAAKPSDGASRTGRRSGVLADGDLAVGHYSGRAVAVHMVSRQLTWFHTISHGFTSFFKKIVRAARAIINRQDAKVAKNRHRTP